MLLEKTTRLINKHGTIIDVGDVLVHREQSFSISFINGGFFETSLGEICMYKLNGNGEYCGNSDTIDCYKHKDETLNLQKERLIKLESLNLI